MGDLTTIDARLRWLCVLKIRKNSQYFAHGRTHSLSLFTSQRSRLDGRLRCIVLLSRYKPHAAPDSLVMQAIFNSMPTIGPGTGAVYANPACRTPSSAHLRRPLLRNRTPCAPPSSDGTSFCSPHAERCALGTVHLALDSHYMPRCIGFILGPPLRRPRH